jgi:ketosteroid isomerase-like protein
MTTGCERRQLSGKRWGKAVCGCFAGLMLMGGCSHPPTVDPKAAEDAVRAADVAWSKAAGAQDLANVALYYAEDATVMPPNSPIVSGRDAAQRAWATMLVPGNSISWAPNTVVSAASGDYVYDQGTYTASIKGADGKAVADTGKYLCVWRKQPDGVWQAEWDMWNSDLPVPVMAAPGVAAKKKG